MRHVDPVDDDAVGRTDDDRTAADAALPPLRRRRLLGLAAAGGAALALPVGPAVAAPDETSSRVPTTMVAEGGVGRAQTPDFPVHHLGVRWAGSEHGATFRVRRAGAWSGWTTLHAGDASQPGRRQSLVYVGAAEAYEVRAARGSRDLRVWAINSVDGPRRGRRFAPARRWARRRYLSRAAWGADESLRFDDSGAEIFPTAYFDVQTLTVHHTVTVNSDPDPAATVRAIYAFQSLPPENFGDVGYHLLIDQQGRVYEGRYSGADGLPVGKVVDGRWQMSNGAHVADFNAGNVGVALLGDFTARQPSAAARRSLVGVLAVLSGLSHLDPRGTTDYVNPISAATATVPTLAGHRDWAATECPGDAYYPHLPSLRRDVAALLR